MNRFTFLMTAAMLACGAAARPAAAKVNVVTTDQSLAWVVSAIGGKNVSVDYFASSNQDPHLIEPRPSQVIKMTRADLLVRAGMDLDLWLDSLIRASGNSKIALNGRGYVDASRGIKALQIPIGKLDPSQGDIHVFGNPHYLFGPSNLKIVGRTVADGLKRVDSAHADSYETAFKSMVAELDSAMTGWKSKLSADRKKKVVTYHPSLIYFLHEFGIEEIGNVEPKPGLEPTPGHVAAISREMKAQGVKAILVESFRPKRYAELVARQSGGAVIAVPGGVGAEKGINDYFAFIGAIVDRVAAAL